MLQSGRHLYVLCCCQQAIEKALKALIVRQTGELPPRIHNLPLLAERAGVVFSEERLDFIGELTVFYIQSRYPEEVEALATLTTRENAESTLTVTTEITEWLFSLLK